MPAQATHWTQRGLCQDTQWRAILAELEEAASWAEHPRGGDQGFKNMAGWRPPAIRVHRDQVLNLAFNLCKTAPVWCWQT